MEAGYIHFAIVSLIIPLVMSIYAIFERGLLAYIISNHSTESKRGNHDVKKHCRFSGSIAILAIVILFLAFVARAYSIMWLFYLLVFVSFVPYLASLIYTATGERFQKKS